MTPRRSKPRRRRRESRLLFNLRTAGFLARRGWRIAFYGAGSLLARRLRLRA